MQPPNPHAILHELENPAAYAAELDVLACRHGSGQRRVWQQEGLELSELSPSSRRQLAKALARSVPRGEYRLGPSNARSAFLGGKARTLYRASITDTAVVAVLAKLLRRVVDPLLSERVYSYRPGRSSLEAVRDFADFLRDHRQAIADPRARGLFVLRRDVARYGESIPVDPESPLWSMLDKVFAHWGIGAQEPIAALTRAAVRPSIASEAGAYQLERGVPTGSAIQPVICNLYLSQLDAALGGVRGSFYARFGDDIVFAHADADVAKRARDTADDVVGTLKLAFKAEKSRDFFFNAAGRHSAGLPGAAQLEYLGLRLHFSGAVGLTSAKARRLLREVTRRLDNDLRLTRALSREEALESMCHTASESLDPRRPLAQVMVPLVNHAVDDRGQLRQLDYLVALRIAERDSGQRGVRAFRHVSYQSLRAAGLRSLLVARNRR
ncbi:MAG: reverse transcriptase domain-containing protein [Myxococcota bacterium]